VWRPAPPRTPGAAGISTAVSVASSRKNVLAKTTEKFGRWQKKFGRTLYIFKDAKIIVLLATKYCENSSK
jgi:hypothetical protein